MYDSEKSTVDVFDFFKFSDDTKLLNESSKPSKPSEPSSLSLPKFDDEGNIENDRNDSDFEDDTADSKNAVKNKEAENEEDIAKRKAEIISAAQKKADEIIKEAEAKAVDIKEKAYSEGTDEGYTDGYNKAYEENKANLEKDSAKFFLELRDLINEYKDEKNRLLSESIDELKDVSIAIAEKIIHVSLKTSGDVIKKMIISATEKMRYKEWAKIYISKSDSSLLVEGNTDLMKALSHLSEHIKITVMDDAAPGTCIIELPDQIIDASAATQLDNIRGLLNTGDSTGGGNDSVQ